MKKPVKIISACVACAAAVGLGVFVYSINKDRKMTPTFSSVEEQQPDPLTEPVTEEFKLPDNWSENIPYAPSAKGMTERAKSLLRKNPDVIGYLKIDGTKVDYPVLLDPGEIAENDPFYGPEEYIANSYYLHKDIDRNYDIEGIPFMDYRDVFGSDESEQSENIIIHGHDMMNENQFGSLRRYRFDYGLYDKYPFISLSSNYRDYDYVIFAFLTTSGNYDGNDFVYWNMEELDTKEDFDFFVNRCQSQAMLDTGIDVQYGDKLLTLSTCYMNEDNSRFIVVARRLRDGETVGDMNSIAHTEEWVKAHQPEAETTTTTTTQ
jgi:peptidase C60 sortase A and B